MKRHELCNSLLLSKKKQEMLSLSETAITWEEQPLGKSAQRESFGLAD